MYGRLVADGTHQTTTESPLTFTCKHLSYHDPKACIPTYIKSVSSGSDSLLHFSVCPELLPSQLLPNGSEWTDAIRSCKPYIWLLRRYGPTFLQPPSRTSDFHILAFIELHLTGKESTKDSDVKQTVTFWLQALVTDLFYAGTTSLVDALRLMSTYVSIANTWGPTYPICYPYALCIYKSEQSSWHHNVRYLFNLAHS